MDFTRRSRDKYVNIVDTIHVADAVADTDETYGAYAAAENNTFNNANGSINNANNRNNNANYNSNNMYGVFSNKSQRSGDAGGIIFIDLGANYEKTMFIKS